MPLGVPLGSVNEQEIISFTNVPSRAFGFDFQGVGIASVQSPQSAPLDLFPGLLLDDFILTTSPTGIPPAVAVTNPVPGEVFTVSSSNGVTVGALTAPGSAAVTGVQFFANGNPIGSVSGSGGAIEWTNNTPGSYAVTAVATDTAALSRTSQVVNVAFTQPASGPWRAFPRSAASSASRPRRRVSRLHRCRGHLGHQLCRLPVEQKRKADR